MSIIMNYRDPWRSMFNRLEAMLDDTFETKFQNTGLKKLIHRPHTLVENRNSETNEVENYSLEVVYTPFKKSDVNVSVKDSTLYVRCGSENKERSEGVIFSNISYQSYEFTIPLTDSIDSENISAKAEDGILYISLPVKKPEVIEEKVREISVM